MRWQIGVRLNLRTNALITQTNFIGRTFYGRVRTRLRAREIGDATVREYGSRSDDIERNFAVLKAVLLELFDCGMIAEC